MNDESHFSVSLVQLIFQPFENGSCLKKLYLKKEEEVKFKALSFSWIVFVTLLILWYPNVGSQLFVSVLCYTSPFYLLKNYSYRFVTQVTSPFFFPWGV